MDDLGNIIYLIVIVFAGIAGIMKKLNKKEETYTSVPAEPESDDRDIFRDIFGDHTTIETETTPPPPSRGTFTSSISDDSKLSQEVMQTEIKNLRKTPKKETKKTVNVVIQKEETTTDTSYAFKYNLTDPADARAAFLASEIFNRKY